MAIFRSKKLTDMESDIPVEKLGDMERIRKIDKSYIIIACILVFSWLVWSMAELTGFKLSSINFKFLSDKYSNWVEARSQVNIKTYININFMDKDYIYYYQPDVNGVYRINRDGTGNTRVLEEDVRLFSISNGCVYYINQEGMLKKDNPGTDPVSLLDKQRDVSNFILDGSYIYYVIQEDERREIRRINTDGKNDTKILHENVLDFIPYGNYIYYINSNGQEIDRIRKSGGDEKILLNSEDSMYYGLGIYKGWIYFISNQELHRCRLDGSKESKLEENVASYFIENDYIYYIVSSQNNSHYELYSTEVNGKNKKLMDKQNSYVISIRDGIEEYYDISGQICFKDIKTNRDIVLPEPELRFSANDLNCGVDEYNGTNKLEGINFNNAKMIENKDYVFFIDPFKGGIYKMDRRNGKTTLITDKRAFILDGFGRILFFKQVALGSKPPNDKKLYCINEDGTGLERVFDFDINDFKIEQDGIYFTSNSGSLYKAQFADNKINKIMKEPILDFEIFNGYVYYDKESGGALYRIKEDGTSPEEILKGEIYDFVVRDGYIFYYGRGSDGKIGIYKNKLGSSGADLIVPDAVQFVVNGGYVYYTANGVTGEFYRCDFNGKGKMKLGNQEAFMCIDGDNVYFPGPSGLEKKKLSDIRIDEKRALSVQFTVY